MLFLMVAAVALFAITAANVLLAGEHIWSEEYKEKDCPDYMVIVEDEDIIQNDYISFFKNYPGVTRVESRPVVVIIPDSNIWGGSTRGLMFLYVYADTTLKQGEALIPYADLAQGKLKIGDTMEILFWNQENEHRKLKLSLVGTFVDPVVGGPMFHEGYFPVSQADFDNIRSESEALTEIRVYTRPDVDLLQLQSDFGHNGIFNYAEREESRELILLVPRISSYVLVAIAVLLMLAVLLALRHAVISSIETDYKTIGVLKGLGFKNNQALSFVLLHYTLLTFMGAVTGAGLSVLIQQPALSLFLSFAGLPPKPLLFPEIIAGIVLLLCVMTGISSWLTARRVYRISPAQAIAQGQAMVHFSRRFNPSLQVLSFLPRGVALAVKKIASQAGQYLVVFMVNVIFCYLLVTLTGFYGIMNEYRSAAHLFGCPEGDIGIDVDSDESALFGDANQWVGEIDTILAERYQPKVKKQYDRKRVCINFHGLHSHILGFSAFEDIGYPNPVAGRFPKYDNEVMITPQLQKLCGRKIGDTIILESGNGENGKFTITGITSYSLYNGRIMVTTFNGADSFDGETMRVVILEEGDDTYNVIAQFNDKFKGLAAAENLREENESWTNGVRLGILGVAVFILVIAILLITLTTVLITRIAIYRERVDMGILKTSGYSTNQVRRQFTLRFLLVSAVGCSLGLILSLALADEMMRAILGLAHVYNYVGDKSLLTLLGPFVVLCALTTALAWLSTRSIRKMGVERILKGC